MDTTEAARQQAEAQLQAQRRARAQQRERRRWQEALADFWRGVARQVPSGAVSPEHRQRFFDDHMAQDFQGGFDNLDDLRDYLEAQKPQAVREVAAVAQSLETRVGRAVRTDRKGKVYGRPFTRRLRLVQFIAKNAIRHPSGLINWKRTARLWNRSRKDSATPRQLMRSYLDATRDDGVVIEYLYLNRPDDPGLRVIRGANREAMERVIRGLVEGTLPMWEPAVTEEESNGETGE